MYICIKRMYIYVYMYIHIYIYRDRERASQTARETERAKEGMNSSHFASELAEADMNLWRDLSQLLTP